MDIKAFKLLRIHVSRKGGVDKTKIVIKGTIFLRFFFNHLKAVTRGFPIFSLCPIFVCFAEVNLPTSRFSQSGNLAKEILSRHFPPKFRRIFAAHGLKKKRGKVSSPYLFSESVRKGLRSYCNSIIDTPYII